MATKGVFVLALPVLVFAASCGDQPTEVQSPPRPSVTATGTVTLAPGSVIQDSVNKYAAGTSFLIKSGIYPYSRSLPRAA